MTPGEAYSKVSTFIYKICRTTTNLFYFQLTMFLKKYPELIKIIAKDGYFSFLFAAITNKRFKEGEKAISKDKLYSYEYTVHVLDQKFNPKELKINPIYRKIYKNYTKLRYEEEKNNEKVHINQRNKDVPWKKALRIKALKSFGTVKSRN